MSAKERRLVKRYSASFKQRIVSEIERGEISVAEAQKRYDIGGSSTIDKWLKKMGKLSLLATIVRIEMPHEQDRIKVLEASDTRSGTYPSPNTGQGCFIGSGSCSSG